MKRKLRIPLIILSVLAGLYIVGRVTGTLAHYRFPVASMEPTVPMNSHFFVSNLKKPKHKDIVVYWRTTGENESLEPGTKNTYAFRMMATEGETFQIKNGLACINNVLIEDSSNLYFDFDLPPDKVDALIKLLNLGEDDRRALEMVEFSGYASLTNVEYLEAKKTIDINPYIFKDTEYARLYMNDGEKKWTADNYGPIRIPAGHFFVLGDNRHRAMDSRYTGPIPLKNIVGTVLNK